MRKVTTFINDGFLLENHFAEELYHSSSEGLPIVDYHCHLSPRQIAEDYKFQDITEMWLGGDHYKWRAMRGNGVAEDYITGSAPSQSKFRKWAETVPFTMRNPLYHWTHLELARVFGIYDVLNEGNADYVYALCNEMLASPEFSAKGLLKKFNVEVICTTDDPVDDLRWHKMISEDTSEVKVLPTWRPDKVVAIDDQAIFNNYIDQLSTVSGKEIFTYQDLLSALVVRHEYFEKMGCRLSDHGLDTFYAEEYNPDAADKIFKRLRSGNFSPSQYEKNVYKSTVLLDLAKMDYASDWTQQFHVGPIRDNNRRMYELVGPDTGFDAINDMRLAEAGHRFFSALEYERKLSRTVLYNLNPKDNEVMAALAYTFNDGSVPGKMQYGAAWWFLDNENGIVRQLNTLSDFGLLGRFVGMLTDSRSFLSYTRHEYFRRILCNVLGKDLASGRLPQSEIPFIHKMVGDISYRNAKNYFGF